LIIVRFGTVNSGVGDIEVVHKAPMALFLM
jgi:hypothetical protein